MGFVIFVLPAAIVFSVIRIILCWHLERENTTHVFLPPNEPFLVSEYLDRMEQAQLDILEHQKPVDQTVVLWWGLDGLTLDENGELKWISRKKPEPVSQPEAYFPCQSVLYADNRQIFAANMCQSTQATIDALQMQNAAQQIQAAQQAPMAGIITAGMMVPQAQNCYARPAWAYGWPGTGLCWPN